MCASWMYLVRLFGIASRTSAYFFTLPPPSPVKPTVTAPMSFAFASASTTLGELPEVECHPHLLSQVFLNLLVNAGQAIEGEGKITVRTRLEGASVHVAIADTGRGMTAEQRQKVFSAGFTTNPLGVGTGLGLPISRQIIQEVHGGSIEFESQPGVGTTFHIRIPVR